MPKKKGIKILYIEDDVENVTMLQRIVEFNGYDFISAESGYDGIEKAKIEKPQIILVDMKLPDITGVEIIKILRNLDELKSNNGFICSIFAVSGNFAEDIKGIESAEFDGYLVKPFDIDELLQNLKKISPRSI
jgi:CheY-like chemotaxis protein